MSEPMDDENARAASESAERLSDAVEEARSAVKDALVANVDPAVVLEGAVNGVRAVVSAFAEDVDRERLASESVFELTAMLVNLKHHEDALEAARHRAMLIAGLTGGDVKFGGAIDIDLGDILGPQGPPTEDEPKGDG